MAETVEELLFQGRERRLFNLPALAAGLLPLDPDPRGFQPQETERAQRN